jgi:dihydrofolate reductase
MTENIPRDRVVSRIRVDMTMSLDGFVTGPDDGPDAPMGAGGFRLFNWLDKRTDPGPSGQVYAEALTTRALISGRRTYELAGHWGGDHHDGVPIFVLTHDVPDEPPPGTVRFVTDVGECAALARAAVGDGVAMVHGAGATQALLRAAAAGGSASNPSAIGTPGRRNAVSAEPDDHGIVVGRERVVPHDAG